MGESYLKILKNIIFIIYWIEDEVKYVILTGSHTIVNWEIAMGKRRKSLFLIYLEFVPFYLLYLFVRRLSLKQSYWISRVLFLLLMRVDKRHRVRTIQHLLHAGAADSLSEAHKLAKQVFCQFSKLLIEIFKMDQHYKPEKIHMAGSAESMRYLFEERGNAIIVTAHYGNWEIAGTAFCQKTGLGMVSIMRPFSNPLIGKCILKNRRSPAHEVISKQAGLRPLLKALHDGRHISILIDQHASSKEGVETTFWGHPCRTHKTPALLHLKTGIPVIPAVTRRLNNNFEFEFVFAAPIVYSRTQDKEADIQTITQLCTTALEGLISRDLTQWMWAPRRWLDINRDPYS